MTEKVCIPSTWKILDFTHKIRHWILPRPCLKYFSFKSVTVKSSYTKTASSQLATTVMPFAHAFCRYQSGEPPASLSFLYSQLLHLTLQCQPPLERSHSNHTFLLCLKGQNKQKSATLPKKSFSPAPRQVCHLFHMFQSKVLTTSASHGLQEDQLCSGSQITTSTCLG